MVSIMTALWFHSLGPDDRVSVKPHASPVLHAVNYLLGDLPAAYMTTLRDKGGLQAYPSRSKDPDRIDYSTGSVGIDATAPVRGAVARRYVDGLRTTPPRSKPKTAERSTRSPAASTPSASTCSPQKPLPRLPGHFRPRAAGPRLKPPPPGQPH